MLDGIEDVTMAGKRAPIIQCQYDTMKQISNTFQRHQSQIEQMANSVNVTQQRLADGGWLGKGAEAFYAEMQTQVLPAVYRLCDALGLAARTTHRIASDLRTAEEEAARLFQVQSDSAPTRPDIYAGALRDAQGNVIMLASNDNGTASDVPMGHNAVLLQSMPYSTNYTGTSTRAQSEMPKTNLMKDDKMLTQWLATKPRLGMKVVTDKSQAAARYKEQVEYVKNRKAASRAQNTELLKDLQRRKVGSSDLYAGNRRLGTARTRSVEHRNGSIKESDRWRDKEVKITLWKQGRAHEAVYRVKKLPGGALKLFNAYNGREVAIEIVRNGAYIKAGALAGFSIAEYEGQIKLTRNISASTIARAGVMARGELKLNIAGDNVSVEGNVDLFAGGRADATVGYKGSWVSWTASGNARAGIGLTANAKGGFQAGQFVGKLDLGAALGLGAGVKFEIAIDGKAILRDAVFSLRPVHEYVRQTGRERQAFIRQAPPELRRTAERALSLWPTGPKW